MTLEVTALPVLACFSGFESHQRLPAGVQMFPPVPKAAFLATFAVLVIGASGCASEEGTGSEAASSLLLRLTITDGVEIDEVMWKVSGGEMEDMMGTIDTSAPQATASVELFGVPEGFDYLIEMEALSTDGVFFCKGSSNFNVMIGVATPVDVTLSCQRECSVLICEDVTGECQSIDLPDGSSCAAGLGFCVGGSCQTPGS